MNKNLIKATAIWLVIVLVAILNGSLRDIVLVPWLGMELALPLSGVFLSMLIFLLTLLLIPFVNLSKQKTCLWIGLMWLVFTLAFEFIFGYFVVGKSWREIQQVFDWRDGNLFSLVIFVTTFSPWVAAKVRGLI